jgi:hypothetical protein
MRRIDHAVDLNHPPAANSGERIYAAGFLRISAARSQVATTSPF